MPDVWAASVTVRFATTTASAGALSVLLLKGLSSSNRRAPSALRDSVAWRCNLDVVTMHAGVLTPKGLTQCAIAPALHHHENEG